MLVDEYSLCIIPRSTVLLYEQEGLWTVGPLPAHQLLPRVADLPQDAPRHAVHAVQLAVLGGGHHHLAQAKPVRGLITAR
jgi:hypothetical protein